MNDGRARSISQSVPKSLRNGVHHANAVVWGPVYNVSSSVSASGLRSRPRLPRRVRRARRRRASSSAARGVNRPRAEAARARVTRANFRVVELRPRLVSRADADDVIFSPPRLRILRTPPIVATTPRGARRRGSRHKYRVNCTENFPFFVVSTSPTSTRPFPRSEITSPVATTVFGLHLRG